MSDKPALPPVTPLLTGRYRHSKTGNEYEVLGIGRHSETLEELVVYRALYGDGGLWVRPRAMFTRPATCQGRRNVDRCSSTSTDDSPSRDVAAKRWVWYQPSSFSFMLLVSS